MEDTSQTPSPGAKSLSRRRLFFGAFCILLVGVIAAPHLLSHTTYRDVILNRLLDDPELSVAADSADFGWLSPVGVNGIEIVDPRHQRLKLTVERMQAERSWLEMLSDSPNLGRIDFEHANAVLKLPIPASEYTDAVPDPLGPLLQGHVNDFHVSIQSENSTHQLFDLANMSFSFEIKRSAATRLLDIHPMIVLEHVPLTLELCDDVLRTITPVVADVVEADGEISLRIDTCQIPLDLEDEDQRWQKTDIHGVLTLHSLRARFKTPLLRGIVDVMAADAGKEIPEIIQLSHECEVRFEVRRDGLYHEGLEFGLPDVAPDLVLRSRGTIGLDESLNLTVEAPNWAVEGNLPSKPEDAKLIPITITGNLEEPVVTVP
jgi:hypothetical protein